MSHWRDRCRPIIRNVIEAWNGKDKKDLRDALFEAYPFGERKRYPYKVWLSEIAFQTKKKKVYWKSSRKQEIGKDQLKMF